MGLAEARGDLARIPPVRGTAAADVVSRGRFPPRAAERLSLWHAGVGRFPSPAHLGGGGWRERCRRVPGRQAALPPQQPQMEGEDTGTPGMGIASTRGGQVSVCVTRAAFEPHLRATGKGRNN